jgi:hypothetical protein
MAYGLIDQVTDSDKSRVFRQPALFGSQLTQLEESGGFARPVSGTSKYGATCEQLRKNLINISHSSQASV